MDPLVGELAVDDPGYGYRLLADEARRAGEAGCNRAVWRICRDQQWWSAFGRRRGKNGKKPGPPAHDDRVRRDFTADKPNELWRTDIREHPPARASCICARSRTSSPTGSWATRSAIG